jgi:uncharacterized protein (TIGR00369 family)
MDDVIVNDGPEDRCFGCGHQNEHGLKLRFRVAEDREVETEYTAPETFCGAPGVVHGGIQAALLDEVLGIAAHVGAPAEGLDIATVDFRLRFRRPTPANAPLTVRGRLMRVEGRDYFVEGEIVASDGEILTRAEARWRRIDGRK